ncbi:MAG: hypothetical protein JNM43_19040 [Planctomycetaceae bacterium]|nr:hypothetical protein [Planctomycetaceae bacterium]
MNDTTEPNPRPFNGWANYETWATALWLDNERSGYEQCRREAAECWKLAESPLASVGFECSQLEAAQILLAGRLADSIDHHNPIEAPCLFADLLNAALGEVNWLEIAQHYLAELMEAGKEEPGRGGRRHGSHL